MLEELYGPVVIDQGSKYCLGATVGSNNTGELSGIIEAMLWLSNSWMLTCTCGKKLVAVSDGSGNSCHINCICPKLVVSIRYDSEYAYKSITGQFRNMEKNTKLIRNGQLLYKSLQSGGVMNASHFIHPPPAVANSSSNDSVSSLLRRPTKVIFEKVCIYYLLSNLIVYFMSTFI